MSHWSRSRVLHTMPFSSTPGERRRLAGFDLDEQLRRNDPIIGTDSAQPPSDHRSKSVSRILLVLLALLAGLGFGVVDSLGIRVERVVVTCPGLRPALDGYSIIQLSDLHSTPEFTRNFETARLLAGLHANLAVVTGDFRDSRGSSLIAARGARLALGPLLNRMPVYAVQGNNDHRDTMTLLASEGLRVLDNRAVPLADGLWLAGWNPYGNRQPSLGAVWDGIPRDASVVLAAHSPDVMLEEGVSRAELVIAGHTHGIQIRIPGLPSPITLTRLGWRYTRGLHKFDGTLLYINRGIGTTMIPLRVFSAPEISILTLRARPKT
jgi:predicted MPP superfamily phosphohydrolase